MLAGPVPLANAPARARFVSRDACIACGSTDLRAVAQGRFDAEPLRGFLAADPWGEDPLPALGDAPWELRGCAACGQVFHRWVLDDAWQKLRFRRWMGEAAMRSFAERVGATAFPARWSSGTNRIAHVLRLERLTRELRTRDEAPRVLDFGCGWGELVATATLAGCDAHGVDWDAHRLRGAGLGGDRLVGSLSELDPSLRFHAVTLFEVLEHLTEPLEVLRQLRYRLAFRGILVVEVPDCSGVDGIRTLAEYRAVHPLEHINAFTPASLERFVERVGFRRIETPAAWVTADPVRLARTAAQRALAPWRRTTQAYFRREE
ncbi:Methyltransferase type 12 [Anaeromyxobacter sp. K]|uniref:class I SAM-dependent methyltransferase n=1 Tax=Anaeromyxobacter sp. (strain K) TaxID=447217 RepID=UPI00015F8F12|nr:class I SAM-dependent methyltransferase [Anaeromyxobacter sp. K]ACG72785.1 Methyltransferase type 12 [Anaeromyxobacter sp. K]